MGMDSEVNNRNLWIVQNDAGIGVTVRNTPSRLGFSDGVWIDIGTRHDLISKISVRGQVGMIDNPATANDADRVKRSIGRARTIVRRSQLQVSQFHPYRLPASKSAHP